MKSVLKISLAAFIISLFFFTLTLTSASPAHAQLTPLPADEAINEINRIAIDKDIFDDKIFNLNQISGTVDSLTVLLTGFSQLHPQTNAATQGSGAIAASGRLVATLYTAPPASGVEYFAQEIQKINPIQPAYAQEGGIGFNALRPVQDTWTAFRNISYVGFVIVFVVIGFMVMFRAKISPQAVATVQDSLPRIVVALILVTFSYAIVGLMIDIMFVVLNVIINVLKSQLGLNNNPDIVFSSNIFKVIMSSQKDIFATVFTAIAETIQSLIKQDFLNKVLGFFGGGLAGIIMGIAMIFVMFRLFFMLLIAYVSIIILTVLSPILLLFHAMPGNNGAKDWFRQVAANIAVFPAVAIMIVLAGALSGIGKLGGNTATMFDSANVGQFPLLTGGLNLQNVGSLIGLGILLMTPAVGNMVKERFGVKGGAIAAGAGMAAATLGAAGRAARAPADYYAKPYLQARQGKRYMDYLDKMRGQRETVPPGHEPGKLPGQS